MVRATFDSAFRTRFSKIKDSLLKEKIIKKVERIKEKPETGKPMRYARKGTREVRIPPFRISYRYRADTIEFLAIYHKDEQ